MDQKHRHYVVKVYARCHLSNITSSIFRSVGRFFEEDSMIENPKRNPCELSMLYGTYNTILSQLHTF